MKKILIGLLAFTSISVFADCSLSFNKPKDGAMSVNYISDKTYNQLLEILASKGYVVLSAEEQDMKKSEFNLRIKGYYGYGCGTGLTFTDYLTVPAYNLIEFKGADGVRILQEKSFSAIFGVRRIAKRHLIKSVQSLPNCTNN